MGFDTELCVTDESVWKNLATYEKCLNILIRILSTNAFVV